MLTKVQVRRSVWALLAGGLALTLLVGVSLLFSNTRSLAEPAAVAGVRKTVNTAHAGPGDVLTYTVVISNAGTGVTAWMTDVLPAELDYVDGSLEWFGPGSAGGAGDVITWTAAEFGWGQRVVLTFSAQVSTGVTYATVVNTAQFTGTGALLTDSAVTNVSLGELSAAKTVQPASARPGEQLVYTVYITNTGGAVVGTAWMTDVLPAEVNYVGGLSASTGSAGVAGDVVTWTLTGPLAPSEAASVTFAVEVDGALSEATTFTNTAQIAGAGGLLSPYVEVRVAVNLACYLPQVFKNYPPKMVLRPIPAPGANNTYIVSWDPITGTTQYVLQESTDPNFPTSAVTEWKTTNTSRPFEKGSAVGTYYYRVRADGPWGTGVWSNVESIKVGFFDNFSDIGSGWPQVAVKMVGTSYYRLRYDSGQYRITLDPGGPEVWFHQPTALAPYAPPTDKYCVEVDVRIMKAQDPYQEWNFYPYWANGGLVFGSNESKSNLYAMCLSVGAEKSPGGPADLGWYLVHNPTSAWPYEGCHPSGTGYSPGGESVGLSTEQWHKFKVGVDDNNVTVYLNGVRKGTWTMPGLKNMTRVGVVGGDYEVTPVDFRFDNFKVIPNMACTP